MENKIFIIIEKWDDPVDGEGTKICGAYSTIGKARKKLRELVKLIKSSILVGYFKNDVLIADAKDIEYIENDDAFFFSDNSGNGTCEERYIKTMYVE